MKHSIPNLTGRTNQSSVPVRTKTSFSPSSLQIRYKIGEQEERLFGSAEVANAQQGKSE